MGTQANGLAIKDFAVYLLVRILVCIIQMLSFRATQRLANQLAWLAYRVDKRHRLVALENLRHAFGDALDDRERDEMVRRVYRHFCGLALLLAHIPRKLHPTNWKDFIELGGGDRMVEMLLSGRPLLFVTGHYGNWELGGYSLGMFGFTTYAVARDLDNPYLDRFLRSFRERTGQKILAKKGDFNKMEHLLASGGVIATLGDQDAGQRGLFVDFFGRPASTHKAVALLSLEHQVPMIVVGVPQIGEPLRYRIEVGDVILPEEYAGQPDAVPAMTRRFTTALETMIRRHPEQYFWLHRRWKHQPQRRGKNKAA
jgi:KDO2-lipid IV(A) lauroyltransferase